jgi:hypothetical protein
LSLWLLTSLYIALAPTRHYTPDAVNNLVFIEGENRYELWHTQHLLAQWPGYWTYQVAGGRLRAWEAMRAAHALLAGATVGLLYAATRELTGSQKIAIASGLFLWFSYGFWHYQSDPDIYSAGYTAVTLLFFAYVRYLSAPTAWRAVLLGIASALAILMHQLNLELAGLSLIVAAWSANRSISDSSRDPTRIPRPAWRHVGLYAAISVLIPLAVYLIGWLSASPYLVELGGEAPPLLSWVSGYFRTAQAGEATWGVSLSLTTLPTAAYTFVLSWILPPQLNGLITWEIVLLALLLAAALALFVHMAWVLRRVIFPQRLVAAVCALTLVANGISGWWWQAGNMKFYLFMQIPLILLAALYARQMLTGWQRHLRRVLLGGVMGMVMLFHVALTLRYETQGGVFAVADLAGGTPVTVWFQSAAQAEAYRYTSNQGEAAVLPEAYCENPPATRTGQVTWWVVREDEACPALAGAPVVGRYQADRSRATWLIHDVTQPE